MLKDWRQCSSPIRRGLTVAQQTLYSTFSVFVRGIKHFAFQKPHLPSRVQFQGNYDSALLMMRDFKLLDVWRNSLNTGNKVPQVEHVKRFFFFFIWITKYLMYLKCITQHLKSWDQSVLILVEKSLLCFKLSCYKWSLKTDVDFLLPEEELRAIPNTHNKRC